MRMVVTAVALSLCVAATAQAQSADWIVLPTTTEEGALWMGPAAGGLSRALRRQGVGVWSSGGAVAAFERRGSAAPAIVSEEEVEAWAARSQSALRLLASGDDAAALAELERAQAFSRNAVETLNRDPGRAKIVLDTCLYLVRALSQRGQADRARQQAEECVRLAPASEPTWQMHPPGVVQLYEAAAQPGPSHASSLLVESEPRACGLRVNGVHLGETPMEVTGLYPGRYRIQMECDPGAPARVHFVDVPKGATSVFVLDRFDQAVRTSPGLHLQYEVHPDATRLSRDAREVGRILRAPMVVTASTLPGGDVLELRAVAGTQAEPDLVRIATTPEGPSPQAISDAAAALLAGQCKDFTGPAPQDIDCRTGEPIGVTDEARKSGATRARPPKAQFRAGLVLASAGTVSLLTGYALWIARRPAGDDWISNATSLSAQDKWLGLGTAVRVTAPLGGGLLTAAMPLVLPYRSKPPWWAWLHGGLGLAAATGAVVSGVTAAPKPPNSCEVNGPDPQPCVDRERDVDRAIVLASTAAPLLTMPLVYVLRRDRARLDTAWVPSIAVSRQGGTIVVGGAF